MLQPQERNAELVGILRTDFQHLTDPPRLFYLSISLSDAAPTNAALDAAIETPANLPGNCIFLVDDSDGVKWWLCVPETVTGEWLYIQFTIAA